MEIYDFFVLINTFFGAMPIIVYLTYLTYEYFYNEKINKAFTIYFDNKTYRFISYFVAIKKFIFLICLSCIGIIINILLYGLTFNKFLYDKTTQNLMYIQYLLIGFVFVFYCFLILVYYFKNIYKKKIKHDFILNYDYLYNVICLQNFQINNVKYKFYLNIIFNHLFYKLKATCGMMDVKNIVFNYFKLCEFYVYIINNKFLNKINNEQTFFKNLAYNKQNSKKEYATILMDFLNSTICLNF